MTPRPTEPDARGQPDVSTEPARQEVLERMLTLPTPDWGRWLDYRAHGVSASDERALIDVATDSTLLLAEMYTPESWAPVHAWRSLAQLRSAAAVTPLLSIMDTLEENLDWMAHDLPEVLASVGLPAVPPTTAWAADRTRVTYARMIAVEALGMVGARHRAAREACVDGLTRLLEGFREEGPDFNAMVIGELVSLDAREAAPLMRAAFEAERVDVQFMGDWEDVQIELGLLSERLTPSPFGRIAEAFEEDDREPLPGWRDLDEGSADLLGGFLGARRGSGGALTLRTLEGLLFAVSCGPDVVPPSEWVAIVLGEDEPEFDDEEEAGAVLGAILGLYQRIQEGVNRPSLAPPEGLFRDDLMSNLEHDADVAQWSRGFLMGHMWLEEEWEPAAELDEDLGTFMFILSFFSSRSLAERFRAELAGGDMPLEDMAGLVRRLFPDALSGYAGMGRALLRDRVRSVRPQPARATVEERTGRNDPCPCGSGRKFKKCCGSNRG